LGHGRPGRDLVPRPRRAAPAGQLGRDDLREPDRHPAGLPAAGPLRRGVHRRRGYRVQRSGRAAVRAGPGGGPVTGPLLEVDGLTVRLEVRGAKRAVLRDVALSVRAGEALGLVGESGSGKSMTARAIDRLLPRGAEVDGTVSFDGRDVNALAGADLRRYRNQVAMIFQDPRAHVNPVRRIGDYVTEALRTNL